MTTITSNPELEAYKTERLAATKRVPSEIDKKHYGERILAGGLLAQGAEGAKAYLEQYGAKRAEGGYGISAEKLVHIAVRVERAIESELEGSLAFKAREFADTLWTLALDKSTPLPVA